MKCGLVHESEFEKARSPWRVVLGRNSKARRIGEYYLFIEAAEDDTAFDFDILDEEVDKQAWLDERMTNNETVVGNILGYFPQPVVDV